MYAFRKWLFSLLRYPGSSFFVIGFICYVLSFAASLKWLLFPGLLIIAFSYFWLRFIGRRRISPNFVMVRSVPLLEGATHWMIFAAPTKESQKRSCRENLRSLREDRALVDVLPAGNYTTITHKAFLKVVQRSDRVSMAREPEYLYLDSLQGVLQKMTGKRCKSCPSPCRAWTDPPREFYFVRFTIS